MVPWRNKTEACSQWAEWAVTSTMLSSLLSFILISQWRGWNPKQISLRWKDQDPFSSCRSEGKKWFIIKAWQSREFLYGGYDIFYKLSLLWRVTESPSCRHVEKVMQRRAKGQWSPLHDAEHEFLGAESAELWASHLLLLWEGPRVQKEVSWAMVPRINKSCKPFLRCWSHLGNGDVMQGWRLLVRAPSASLCPYMDFQFPIMGMKGVLFSMLILYITMSYKETMAYRKVKLVTVLDPAGLLPGLSYASIGVGLTKLLDCPCSPYWL